MLHWQDCVALLIIFAVSYWIAFVSGVSDYFFKKKSKKPRGTITGKESKSTGGSFIKRFDVLILFRSESEKSTRLAEEFSNLSKLKCESCEADGYDFEVLEHLNIPVVFIVDKSSDLHEFIVKKEKDSKDVRAYRRRYLNNLRFVVIDAGDFAFAQFVDEGLAGLGAKRLEKMSTVGIKEGFVGVLKVK